VINISASVRKFVAGEVDNHAGFESLEIEKVSKYAGIEPPGLAVEVVSIRELNFQGSQKKWVSMRQLNPEGS